MPESLVNGLLRLLRYKNGRKLSCFLVNSDGLKIERHVKKSSEFQTISSQTKSAKNVLKFLKNLKNNFCNQHKIKKIIYNLNSLWHELSAYSAIKSFFL